MMRRALWLIAGVLAAALVGVVCASFFVPIGARAGVILDAPYGPAWRVGVTRGVLTYRREDPAIMGGQHLAWTSTLRGDDPFGPWHRDVSWWRVVWSDRTRPGSVMEARLPLTPAAAVCVLVVGVSVRGRVVQARRRKRGACVRCGYALEGADLCPECGDSRTK